MHSTGNDIPVVSRDSDLKKYTLYIVDLYMTKLYEEVSQIVPISEALVLSRLGRLEWLHHRVTGLTDCVTEGHLTASPVWWLTASALWRVTTSSLRWVTTSSVWRLTTPGATSDCVVCMGSRTNRPIVESHSEYSDDRVRRVYLIKKNNSNLSKIRTLSSEKRPRNAWGAPTKSNFSWLAAHGVQFWE